MAPGSHNFTRVHNLCFSPEVSFAAAAVLIPCSVYSISRARKVAPKFLMLAALPAVFGLQQICEGFVWLGLNSGTDWLVRISSLAFLFIASIFWPCWIPLSSARIDTRNTAKRFFYALSALGTAVGLAFYIPVLFNSTSWLTTKIAGHSIQYDFKTLRPLQDISDGAWQLVYALIIFIPLLASERKQIKIFGVLVVLSAVLSYLVFSYAFLSVWCLFAAVLSAYLVVMLHQTSKGHPSPQRL